MVLEKTGFFPALHCREGQLSDIRECLAEEVPVALEYNGLSHAVMLATPGDLEDFALGFSLTEGVVADASEFYGCEVNPQVDGIRVAIDIAAARFHELKEKRRTLTGRTGCGICGAESLAFAVRSLPRFTGTALFTAGQLHAGFTQMEARQQLRKETGATHAAAWMNETGEVSLLREDVGRHNALDKLIGALIRQKVAASSGAVLVTSRASYEMVSKCAFAGIGVLAAVSAPTALAVRMAERSALTLIGFVRQGACAIYSCPDRIR